MIDGCECHRSVRISSSYIDAVAERTELREGDVPAPYAGPIGAVGTW
jgi:hypothetical protein